MDRIFNADEAGMSYKMLSSRILVAKANGEAPGAKNCEKHATALMCANASGSF